LIVRSSDDPPIRNETRLPEQCFSLPQSPHGVIDASWTCTADHPSSNELKESLTMAIKMKFIAPLLAAAAAAAIAAAPAASAPSPHVQFHPYGDQAYLLFPPLVGVIR
jgi:hypothetical protein